jgi:excisionase family DNA binding protein
MENMSGGGFVKRWMTVPEVASYFSCSRRYVYTLVEAGRLSVINLGGQIGARGIRIEAQSILKLEQTAALDIPQDEE